MFEENRFEDLLKSLRVRQGKEWTQARTAQSLGVSSRTYRGWENGESLPKARDLKNIEALFKLNETETDALFRAASRPAPVIQNLPFLPNPFFTGRESELRLLSQLFEQNKRIAITQPISVSGLGGIGKTQLALEYAHRCHPHIYRSIFFINAADKASLEASYLTLSRLLQLPEEKEKEIDRTVQAVKIWLEEHTRWLLLLDNADDLELARSFLPTQPRGHILFTTRSQIVGPVAALVQVDALSPQEGLLFLLRRSGFLKVGTLLESIAPDLRREALSLVEMLSGHPLALDQAGAYIEEISDPEVSATGVSFAAYRQLYQQRHRVLLERRGSFRDEHPTSVTLTFEISFGKACELHPSCADILSFCSLLHPDAIPEDLLCQEAGLNLDLFLFNEGIRALRCYSLVKRDRIKKMLSVHRLIQVVRRDGMDAQQFRQWSERVVRALNEAFPEVEFEQWSRCEQLLPHVLVCATSLLREVVAPAEAAHLLRKAGNYLWRRGQYSDTEPLYQQSLAIREQHLGASHPDTAKSLHDLAAIYHQQGKYEQAEPLYQRALVIRERHLGTEHPDTARSLGNLAELYRCQGKYEQAEALHRRALAIREQHLGVSHPDTAKSLHNLAILYKQQGKYEQAEPLYQRALSIRERHLGTEHPDTAQSLSNLAELYRCQGKYEQAEALHRRALAIREQHLGTEHPNTAQSLNNLAILCWNQGKYEQAEALYQRALAIREQHLGTEHPDTAQCLNNLAIIYKEQGKYEQAEPMYQRALSIWERHLGASHPDVAACLNNLAELYQLQGKYEQAEPMYQRTLSIWEQRLGAEHPSTAEALHGLAELYQLQGKYEQAESFHQRALAIREQCLGTFHPDTAMSMNNLAFLYWQQGKYEQAEPLYLRALAILEQCLGTEHPDTADALHGLAQLCQQQGKHEQAEALYQRALRIRASRLGPAHPKTQETSLAYTAFRRSNRT